MKKVFTNKKKLITLLATTYIISILCMYLYYRHTGGEYFLSAKDDITNEIRHRVNLNLNELQAVNSKLKYTTELIATNEDMIHSLIKSEQTNHWFPKLFQFVEGDQQVFECIRILNKDMQEVILSPSNQAQRLAKGQSRYIDADLSSLSKEQVINSPYNYSLSQQRFNCSEGNIFREGFPRIVYTYPILNKSELLGTVAIDVNTAAVSHNLTSYSETIDLDDTIIPTQKFFMVIENSLASHYHFEDLENDVILDLDESTITELVSLPYHVIKPFTLADSIIVAVKLMPNFDNGPSVYLYEKVYNSSIESIYENKKSDLLISIFQVVTGLSLIIPAIYSVATKVDENKTEKRLIEEVLSGLSPIAIVDKKMIVKRINSAMCEMTGYREDELIGDSFISNKKGIANQEQLFGLISQVYNNEVVQTEICFRTKENIKTYAIVRASLITSEFYNNTYIVMSMVDITKQKVYENKLLELTYRDPLSLLWNRRKFKEVLDSSLDIISTEQEIECYLVILDIDDFKLINDNYGHSKGDTVIQQVAECLQNSVRKQDTVCRIGGEEFGIIFFDISKETLVKRLQQIHKQVPLTNCRNATLSGGGCLVTGTTDTIYRTADHALYQSKENGKNQFTML